MKPRVHRFSKENVERLTEALEGFAQAQDAWYENEFIDEKQPDLGFRLPTRSDIGDLAKPLIVELEYIKKTRALVASEQESNGGEE